MSIKVNGTLRCRLFLQFLFVFRVFGHFEKPVFLTLCKHVDVVRLHAGSYLFKIGNKRNFAVGRK